MTMTADEFTELPLTMIPFPRCALAQISCPSEACSTAVQPVHIDIRAVLQDNLRNREVPGLPPAVERVRVADFTTVPERGWVFVDVTSLLVQRQLCQVPFHTSACTQRRAPFLLVEGFAFPTLRLARNPFQVKVSIRPMHLFDHNLDHDYYFELLREEEWNAQSIARCSTAHHGDFRAVPRANQIS